MLRKIQEHAHLAYKKLEIDEHRLLYLFLELTQRCNLDCLHCGSDCKSSADGPELTTQSWLKVIDYIADNFGQDPTLILTGGEPLVHPDFDEITAHITKRKLRWGMVTNGIALNEPRIKRLIQNKVYSLTLSVDGMAESHNFLRNHPSAFKRVEHALDLLAQSEIKMRDAVTCVFPQNLNQLDEVADFLVEKKMPGWRLFRIFPNGRAATDPRLLMDHKQTWQMLDWIADNRKKYLKKGLNISASCEGYLPFVQDKKVRDYPFFCRAGVSMASILSDGTITGCTNNDPSFAQGNILKDSFVNIWNNKFEDFRTREWVNDTACASCGELSKCEGGSIHLWRQGDQKPAFCYVHEDMQREPDVACATQLNTPSK